jgi:hypothetical protein
MSFQLIGFYCKVRLLFKNDVMIFLNKFENLILKNNKWHKQSLVSEYFAKTN